MRNSRKQFLRLRLPEGAEVWSAFVDGRAEKPALSDAEETGEGRTVLLKIVHSTEGFPVRLVYASEGSSFGGLGVARGSLPRPDILVTHTRWDVYLPDGMSYRTASTNMDRVASGERLGRDAIAEQLAGVADESRAAQSLDPLRITVPTAGVHYAFEKLYANQAGRDAWFALPYASTTGSVVGSVASALGALLVWVGLALYLWQDSPAAPRVAVGVAGAGVAIVLTSVGVYHVSTLPALVMSVLVAGAAMFGRRRLAQWRAVAPTT